MQQQQQVVQPGLVAAGQTCHDGWHWPKPAHQGRSSGHSSTACCPCLSQLAQSQCCACERAAGGDSASGPVKKEQVLISQPDQSPSQSLFRPCSCV